MSMFQGVMAGISIFILSACAPKYSEVREVADGMTFSFYAPAAKGVAVAGSFNHWDPHRDFLTGPNSRGFWSITLNLPEGRYEYLFIVNGKEWLPDPAAPSTDDGFGGRNSVIEIGNRPPGP